MTARHWLWAALFLGGLSTILRGLAFFPSVIGHDAHDESTYLVIAEALTRGQSLYLDGWDTKPPGVYFALAGILQGVTSVPAIRFVGALIIAATGWLIAFAHFRITGHRVASLLTGCFYVVCLSVLLFYGPVLWLWVYSMHRLWPSRLALWSIAWLALDFLAVAAPPQVPGRSLVHLHETYSA